MRTKSVQKTRNYNKYIQTFDEFNKEKERILKKKNKEKEKEEEI